MFDARKVLVSLAVSVCLFSGVTGAKAATSSDVTNSSVAFKTEIGTIFGSGFFVEGGRVVTNYHVYLVSQLPDAVTVVDKQGNEYTFSLVSYDAAADLAVLKTDAVDHEFLTVAKKESKKIKAVVNSSAQSYESLQGTVIRESLWTRREHYDGKIQKGTRSVLSIIVRGGNSGSPVVNEAGEVVGVIMAKDEKSNGVMVKLNDLQRMIGEGK